MSWQWLSGARPLLIWLITLCMPSLSIPKALTGVITLVCSEEKASVVLPPKMMTTTVRPKTNYYLRNRSKIKEREEENNLLKSKIDKLENEIDGLEEEELNIWVRNKLNELQKDDDDPIDSDYANIIKFNPKGSIH